MVLTWGKVNSQPTRGHYSKGGRYEMLITARSSSSLKSQHSFGERYGTRQQKTEGHMLNPLPAFKESIGSISPCEWEFNF